MLAACRFRGPCRRRFALSIVAAVLACSSSSYGPNDSDGVPDPVATNSVSIVDNAFQPVHNSVREGETVTWSWKGTNAHSIDFDSPSLPDAPITGPGGSHQVTFPTAGVYTYFCAVHGRDLMSGRVTAQGSGPVGPGYP